MSEDKPKRKRPDRAEASKLRKSLSETVVKVSLPGLLVSQDGADAFRAEIESFVENISKSVNKASILLNRFLISRLSQGASLPDFKNQTFYNHCINIGSGRCAKPADGLQETWDECFASFPQIEKLTGNMQALNYAATTLQTNFLNSLWCAFEVRQKYLLKAWIQDSGLDKSVFHPLKCAINGWTCNTPVPVEAAEFVTLQRDILGLVGDDRLSEPWLKRHPQQVIRFYWETLKYLETMAEKYKEEPTKLPKLFSLSPLCTIKRHFVTIDTKVLYKLSRNCGLVSKETKEPDFRAFAADHFKSLFKVDKLASKKLTFSNICLLYTSPSPRD